MTPRQMLPVLHYLRQVKAEPDPAWDDDAALLEQYRCHGDESAFEGLVRRHGPRVLAVCRRVLGDQHDAEDAFQATFLFLARKSANLRQPDRLGSWLHAVAVRTALKARERRRPLLPLADDLASAADHDMLWHDLRPILDEAIASLPGRYRDPVILCFLEGASTSQAAERLGCPPGTISSRLGRARVLLRARLARRGVNVPARMLGGILPAALRDSPVPPMLLKSTFSIGVRVGAVSAAVAALAKGVAMRMMLQKIQGAVLVLLGVVGLGVGAMVYQGKAQEPPATAPAVSKASEVPVMPTMVSPPPIEDAGQKVQERTKNFVVEASSKRVARLVVEAAERLRKEIALKWLEKELPTWDKPCMIELRLKPGLAHGSHSSFAFNDGKVSGHHISLQGTLEQVLSCELPHEVTHLILAHYFGRPIPRWADEGAAVLAEDDEQQVQHAKLLQNILATPNRLIPLSKLLTLRSYPNDFAAFYAQSRSLTAFLLERLKHRQFLAFVDLGQRDSWEAACDRYGKTLGFITVEAMEEAWLSAARKKQKIELASPEGNETRSPTFVEAVIEEGSLVTYHPSYYYQPVTSYVTAGNVVMPVTSYQMQTHMTKQRAELFSVKVTRADGTQVPAEKWQKILATKQGVLLINEGSAISPTYRKLLRDDALIVSIPVPSPVPAPGLDPVRALTPPPMGPPMAVSAPPLPPVSPLVAPRPALPTPPVQPAAPAPAPSPEPEQ